MARLGWGWYTPVPSILGTLALLGCCPHVLRAPVWELPDLPRALAQASPAGCSVCWPWSIQCPLGLQASEHPSGTRRGPLEAQGSQPHLVVQGVEGRSGHGGAVWALQPLLEGAWHSPGPLPHQESASLRADPAWRRGRTEAGSGDPAALSSDPILRALPVEVHMNPAKALPGSALRCSPACWTLLPRRGLQALQTRAFSACSGRCFRGTGAPTVGAEGAPEGALGSLIAEWAESARGPQGSVTPVKIQSLSLFGAWRGPLRSDTAWPGPCTLEGMKVRRLPCGQSPREAGGCWPPHPTGDA